MKFSICLLALLYWSESIVVAQEFGNQPASQANVLDTVEIDLGDRSIFYNRIEQPILKPQKVEAETPQPPPVVQLTAEEEAELRRHESLRFESLFLSVTAYPGKGSVVQWWNENGQQSALSSIDFNHLQHISDFEWNGVYYSTLFFVDSWSPYFTEDDGTNPTTEPIPPFPQTENGSSTFIAVVISEMTQPSAQEVASLEALHAFYDANRIKLIKQSQEMEAARLGQEQWLEANPPIPKDTFVNYFLIKKPSSATSMEPAPLE